MSKPHVVIYGCFWADVGGIEHHLRLLTTHLSDDFRFTIITPMSATFAESVQATCLPYPPADIPRAFSLPAIWRLARQFRQLDADVVHILEARGSTIGVPAATLARVPVIHHRQISPSDYVNGWRRTAYTLIEGSLAWLMIDWVIFVSQNEMDKYGYLMPPQRKQLIPNSIAPIDTPARRHPTRQEIGIKDECFLWVHIGRLCYQKAQDTLLKAAAQLSTADDWHLVIIGDGDDRATLQTMIQTLSLGERVTLLGSLPHDQALAILAASDGFVLPSRFEGLPHVVLEALALHIPMIVTDVGDTWRVSGGGSLPPAALQTAIDDPQQLARTMQHLMNDTPLHGRLKAAAPARFAPYQLDSMLQSMADLYRRTLAP